MSKVEFEKVTHVMLRGDDGQPLCQVTVDAKGPRGMSGRVLMDPCDGRTGLVEIPILQLLGAVFDLGVEAGRAAATKEGAGT